MLRQHAGIVIPLVLCTIIFSVTPLEDFNVTANRDFLSVVNKNGDEVFITADLMKRIADESNAWHWTPWQRIRTELSNKILTEIDCTNVSSVDSFPDSIFTDEQLRQGAFLLYVLFGLYSFTLLAIVCNDFFIPCVEFICEDLKIPKNVAAATFMSVATSCPEFFVNTISTFITKSDMGIGTIVGSAIFNLLGVVAVGGLAASTPIKIEHSPVTRDVIIYMFNVGVLVAIVWDGQVDWYEALALGVLYILYFVVMFNSKRIFNLLDKMFAVVCRKTLTQQAVLDDTKITGVPNKDTCSGSEECSPIDATKDLDSDEKLKSKLGLCNFPTEKSIFFKLWWLYTLPLNIVLGLTIPSPERHRRFYPFAFVMCIIWIGVNSYFVSWSMSVIGATFFIPDSVMGMTFLAFGGCLPEACSIYIMSRRGEGGMGVSNALGANSLAILFALGIPWLIKTSTAIAQGADTTVVYINSTGIDFVVGSLLVATCLLWITLVLGRFRLRKSLGFIFLILYLIFITFAILVEMGIILDRGMEFC